MQRIITRNAAAVQGNWQKQLAQAVSNPAQLLMQLGLEPEHFQKDIQARKLFPMRVPQAFIDRMQTGDANDPLLRQVLPAAHEFIEQAGFTSDPLGEHQSAVPGLLHKYRSRVLLILKGGCAVNCRYCFRRHFPYQDNQPGQDWSEAIAYIAARPEIDEVILSGGDPLMANDRHLAKLFAQLATLPQLQRVRIHTRLPVVIPARVTEELVDLLGSFAKPVVMVTHINHPNEIDEAFSQAMFKLKQAGVQLLNQGVLLRDVNDNADTLCALSNRLFEVGILPYYLFMLDRVAGASHFEVAQEQAIALIKQLYRRLPGYLVPRLSREEAGKSSKTPIDLQM
ncbi:EF-P beta-lysylation protein EpmB [Aliagarivorans taiwanensis]|uniref:EF-P beta-lysylation protein EpmB n=1 Tax=Aliagarivorans taiwanensis TaxID=561966 RepID=UPI000479DC5C|nr:EF-P beta-lysylation protein EpmB [Aliagarivorans taiwanensis]